MNDSFFTKTVSRKPVNKTEKTSDIVLNSDKKRISFLAE